MFLDAGDLPGKNERAIFFQHGLCHGHITDDRQVVLPGENTTAGTINFLV